MKNILLFVLTCAVVFISCKKKQEETPAPNTPSPTEIEKKFISSSEISTTEAAVLKTTIQFLIPDLKPLLSKIKFKVTTYKIEYWTTYKSQKIKASGILCLPDTNLGFPFMSFQHGTLFNDSDVPSNNAAQQIQIAALASVGYVALAPDYLGFGSSTSITHPYYVADYSSHTVVDLIQASKEFLQSKEVKIPQQLFLAGYSQGGNVTIAVAKELESHPLENLALTASGVGAGGYNLRAIFENITGKTEYPSPNYLAYIVQSYRTSFDIPLPLTYFFKEPYAARIPDLINGKTDGQIINSNLTFQMDSLLQNKFVESVQDGSDTLFNNLLTKNSLHNWKPLKPLRFYHGTADEIVPYSDTDSTYRLMLSRGAPNVSFEPLANKNHAGGALPMVSDLLEWFETFRPN